MQRGCLSHKLAEDVEAATVHIVCKRLPVQMFNLDVLFSLQVVLHTFEALDKHDVSGIQCPTERVLLLKPGCKVIFLWNKSDTLRNGTQSRFGGVRGDNLVVDFDGEGKVLAKREAWTKTSRKAVKRGKLTQFPLSLKWRITCHKSQGLTLPSAVFNCTRVCLVLSMLP